MQGLSINFSTLDIFVTFWIAIGIFSATLFLKWKYERERKIKVLDFFVSFFLVAAGPITFVLSFIQTFFDLTLFKKKK